MARPRKGSLIWRTTGWRARLTVEVEGERLQRVVDLGTTDKAVARRRLARKLAETEGGAFAGDLATSAKVETFADAADRVEKLRNAAGVEDAATERSRIRRYADPLIGEMPADAITSSHINTVLDEVAALGRSKGTVVHVRQSVRAVFTQLKREGAIKANPVGEAELPRMAHVPKKERVILTDEEFAAYLAWLPEDERSQDGVLERQTLACVSRMFGGLRTGDLHALAWGQHIDTETFTWGVAPRQKTATPQVLGIPAMLRPTLRQWWDRHGSPDDGPVFPIRCGPDAGGQRRRQSHAKALRRDLMRMLGVQYRVVRSAPTGPRTAWDTKPEDEWTRRERELFSETAYSLPLDFHSFRRAFSTALAEAGVNIQVAMRLTGHTSTSAHARYVMSRVQQMPEAALPRLPQGEEFKHGVSARGPNQWSSGAITRAHAIANGAERHTIEDPCGAACGPFTPATRVQIPLGTPTLSQIDPRVSARAVLKLPPPAAWSTRSVVAMGALALAAVHLPTWRPLELGGAR